MLCHRADGKKIQRFRDARGWTQEQLALVAGYSVKTIWKAEAGGELKRQTLSDVAQALGAELSDIVANPDGLLAISKEQTNKQLVLDAMQAYAEQNVKAVLDRVHRDAVFESPAPERIPYAGTYRGRKSIREYFGKSIDTLAAMDAKYEIECLLADQDFVDLHFQCTERSADTGVSINYPACFHFRFEEGRLIHFREYQDYTPVVAFYEANGWPRWRR